MPCAGQVLGHLSDRVMPGRAKVDRSQTGLLLNWASNIAEVPSIYFFISRNDIPITSSGTSDILKNTTPDTVISLFKTS